MQELDASFTEAPLLGVVVLVYNPALGDQKRRYFVVPDGVLKRRELDELRRLSALEPEYVSYDNVCAQLARRLNCILVGRERPVDAVLTAGESAVAIVELNQPLLNTAVAA